MSSKFLESDVVDSKIFAGRVLTLLGELVTEVRATQRFLEEKFFVPSEYPDPYPSEEELGTEPEDEADV